MREVEREKEIERERERGIRVREDLINGVRKREYERERRAKERLSD